MPRTPSRTSRTLPPTLYVELNSAFPRWSCYVSDRVGTADGGFFKGFKSHAEMTAWLDKHGYTNFVPDAPTP